MKPQAEVRDNWVHFEGHLMTRPRYITRSEWVDFWDRAMDNDDEVRLDSFKEGYDIGYRDGEEENARQEEAIEDSSQ